MFLALNLGKSHVWRLLSDLQAKIDTHTELDQRPAVVDAKVELEYGHHVNHEYVLIIGICKSRNGEVRSNSCEDDGQCVEDYQ